MLKGMVKKGEIVEWGVNEEWEKDNFQINIFFANLDSQSCVERVLDDAY